MQASKRLIRKEEKPHHQCKGIKRNVQEGEEVCLSSPSQRRHQKNAPSSDSFQPTDPNLAQVAETRTDAWDGQTKHNGIFRVRSPYPEA